MPSKILAIEDNPDYRAILVVHLKRWGYETIEAATGEIGIEKAATERPDLIIMDLGLPGISGIAAAAQIKDDPRTSHIPIIAHTAYLEEENKNMATQVGIVAFVTKPSSPELLETTIAKHLPRL